MTTSDSASTPIRVVEVTLAAHQWDPWRAGAEATSRRARRVAAVVGMIVALMLVLVGLVLLPRPARISVLIYAPVGGAVAWAVTRQILTRRGLAPLVAQVRDVVVPALVDRIDTPALVTLLRQGGTLVPEQSTTIIEQRRESVVALVASEYDMSSCAAASFPTGGFGP